MMGHIDSSQPVFESVPCDFCKSTEADLLFEGYDAIGDSPDLFRLVVCSECGMIRQNPRPTMETMYHYYPQDRYRAYLRARIEDHSTWHRLNHQYAMYKRWRLIRKHLPDRGRLLDIGCATGDFLYEISRREGWEVFGIEPNAEMAAYARRRFGFNVYPVSIEAFEPQEGRYDLITLWDVLEHLHFPWQSLKKITELLKPKGLLVISIPNVRSLGARLFGKHWFGWELPRHLYHFPPNAMRASIRKLGLDLKDVRCMGGSHEIFSLSLRNCVQASTEADTSFRMRWVKFFRSQPVKIISSPIFRLIDVLQLGAIHTYYVVKPHA